MLEKIEHAVIFGNDIKKSLFKLQTTEGSVNFQAVRTHRLPREPIISFVGSLIQKSASFPCNLTS